MDNPLPEISKELNKEIIPDKNVKKFFTTLKRPVPKKYLLIPAFLFVIANFFSFYCFIFSRNTFSPTTPKIVENNLALNIQSPNENSLVTEDQVLIKGTTAPNAVVVFYSENDYSSSDADEKGNFEGKINLIKGLNTLNISAYSGDGKEVTCILLFRPLI